MNMACYGVGAEEEIVYLPPGTVSINGNNFLDCCSCPAP